jgi:predicted metal-dependent hydrolase
MRGARKTLAIDVHPDGRVVVKAPAGDGSASPASDDAVAAVVRRRAGWILRKQREFGRYGAEVPPQYVSGASFLHLGRQYRLRVSEGERESVKLLRGYLEVVTPSKRDLGHVAAQVTAWQARQAQRVFAARMALLLPRFAPRVSEEPQIVVRALKTRWGHCTADGRITLNLALIRQPTACIDYVVAHELCHLVEHNHGKGFYALLGRVLPDWAARRARLHEGRG